MKRDVAALYSEHRDFVGRTLIHFGIPEADLADQTHEVFIVVLRRLSTYRGEATMRTWLYAIARRVAASYRRRGYRVRERTVESMQDPSVDAEFLDQAAERVLARRHLNGILDRLQTSHRTALVMADVQGLTRKQIAAATGCRVSTVASRLQRARSEVRRQAQSAFAPRRTSPVEAA